MSIVVRALGEGTIDDFVALFSGEGFADNAYWCGCYCFFYHSPEDPWDATAASIPVHRDAKLADIRAGRSRGHLAYLDGKVVGWLNAAPRGTYANPRGFGKADDGTLDVGLVMCFVVAPSARGRGVASALLSAACDRFREEGLAWVEGYAPMTPPQKEPWEMPWSMHNYHGPLPMYEKAGFTKVGELGSFAVMRKSLK